MEVGKKAETISLYLNLLFQTFEDNSDQLFKLQKTLEMFWAKKSIQHNVFFHQNRFINSSKE